MAVLAECATCHWRQAAKRKKCRKCGAKLDSQKKSGKLRYWISFRMPDGKQRTELVKVPDAETGEFVNGTYDDAVAADGKRKVQKRENRIFDMLPQANKTFQELTDWYLDQESVKTKKSAWRDAIALKNFNEVFGDFMAGQITSADLENYQAKRTVEGRAPKTVDDETGAAKRVIGKAYKNKLVGPDTRDTFSDLKKLLKRGSNARKKILSVEQFEVLLTHLPIHAKQILATGFYTGMRKAEILGLTWDRVDLKNRVIRLEAEHTKDGEARNVPILEPPHKILKTIPRAIYGGPVFTFRGKPVTDIRTGLRTACEKVGIPYGRLTRDGFVFHDLRHTFNTYMRKAGVPQHVIMEITGHSTDEMFRRYDTIDQNDKLQAAKQLQDYLANVYQNVYSAPDQGDADENFTKKRTPKS